MGNDSYIVFGISTSINAGMNPEALSLENTCHVGAGVEEESEFKQCFQIVSSGSTRSALMQPGKYNS